MSTLELAVLLLSYLAPCVMRARAHTHAVRSAHAHTHTLLSRAHNCTQTHKLTNSQLPGVEHKILNIQHIPNTRLARR